MTLPLILFLQYCTAFDLETRIKNALTPSLDNAAFANITFSNTPAQRNLSQYVTGGTAPYEFIGTFSGSFPSYLSVALNNGVLTVARNLSVAPPATLTGLTTLPTIKITVTDSKGNSASADFRITLLFKRVFVTKDKVSSGIHTDWNTGGAKDYSSCGAGDPVEKVNCRCQIAAKSVNMTNSIKYRAWFSSNAINARCNLTNQLINTCPMPAQFAGGPWYNMGNSLVAADLGTATTAGNVGLFNATGLTTAVLYQEDGSLSISLQAWAGTASGGVAGTNCNNWTSGIANYGQVDQTNGGGAPNWYGGGTQDCAPGSTTGFQCFEAD